MNFLRFKSKGLTLIEMLVVITIFTIMTAVIMADFPSFRDKTALDLIAQEIATTIRQAQVYGIGTREAGSKFTSYGIYFDLSDTTNLGKKAFYLYADKDATNSFSSPNPLLNCNQTGEGENEDCLIEKFTITGTAEISELCADGDCTSQNLNNLDIFFQRFYPEADFVGITPSYVQIVVQSTRNTSNQRKIEVRKTGQIVVGN